MRACVCESSAHHSDQEKKITRWVPQNQNVFALKIPIFYSWCHRQLSEVPIKALLCNNEKIFYIFLFLFKECKMLLNHSGRRYYWLKWFRRPDDDIFVQYLEKALCRLQMFSRTSTPSPLNPSHPSQEPPKNFHGGKKKTEIKNRKTQAA